MNSKLLSILAICFSLCFSQVRAEHIADYNKDTVINKEASNPDFIHAYLLVADAGKALFSISGHAAIRLVCKEKGLDYSFSFELDMNKSSYLDAVTRKGKAGFIPIPTEKFLNSYKQEGRGVQAFELNLTPKEKQNLWKVLDSESMEGPVWTFDCTSVNCMSMVTYAINKSVVPMRVKVMKLPHEAQGDLSEWIDYVAKRSPWVHILMHLVFFGTDESQIKSDDLLMPEMMIQVMPYMVVVDSVGHPRKLMKGSPIVLLPQIYEDKPCLFSPTVAMLLLLALLSFVLIRRKMKIARVKGDNL